MPNLTFIANLKAVDAERPESSKTPHSEVSYINPSPVPQTTCSNCRNFIAPDRCKTVKAPVALTAWCSRYQPWDKT